MYALLSSIIAVFSICFSYHLYSLILCFFSLYTEHGRSLIAAHHRITSVGRHQPPSCLEDEAALVPYRGSSFSKAPVFLTQSSSSLSMVRR